MTKADGGEWTYFYNENNVLTQIIDPYGGATKFLLDDLGRVAGEMDPNGNITRIVYDGAGSLIGKVTPLGDFVALPEDPDAQYPRAHRVPGCPLEWEYGDLLPRKKASLPAANDPLLYRLPVEARECVKTSPPPGPQGSLHESARARSLYQVPPAAADSGLYTTTMWDPRRELGLHMREIGPQPKQRCWTYDASGNRVAYRDRDGGKYQYEYTSWDFRSRERDPLGNEVAYRYTRSGKISAVIDPGGTVHDFVYDLKDRITGVLCDGVLIEEYKYDNSNNLVQKLNGRGEVLLSFEIGPGNLKKTRRLASGEKHEFKYDERGRLVETTTDEFAVQFAYDAVGNRIEDLRDGRGVRRRFEMRKLVETKIFEKYTTRYQHRQDGALIIQDPGGGIHRIRRRGCGLIERSLSNYSAGARAV